MVKKNRGQLKIQQMAFVLIAVTLFFALVGLFMLSIKFSGLKQSATDLEEKNAMLLAAKIADSPEFSCGEAYDTGKTTCVDFDKVMMLKKNIDKYSDFWGVSNIEIRRIYPENKGKLCKQGDYFDCDTIRMRPEVNGFAPGNFVSLCRKESFEGDVYNKCEVAKIMVSYEEQ